MYEDRWQYDPRYVGGFDDEIDARRDLAKDDFDRRSIHSEHSARSVHSEQSVHSRRSSFSSRSQQVCYLIVSVLMYVDYMPVFYSVICLNFPLESDLQK